MLTVMTSMLVSCPIGGAGYDPNDDNGYDPPYRPTCNFECQDRKQDREFLNGKFISESSLMSDSSGNIFIGFIIDTDYDTYKRFQILANALGGYDRNWWDDSIQTSLSELQEEGDIQIDSVENTITLNPSVMGDFFYKERPVVYEYNSDKNTLSLKDPDINAILGHDLPLAISYKKLPDY